MTERYIPHMIYKNIPEFLKYRKVVIDPKYEFMPEDELIKHLRHYEYVKISGTRTDKHGTRPFFIILIAPGSKYAINTPQFKKIFGTIKDTDLDSKAEIVIISEQPLTNFIKHQIRTEKTEHPGIYIENYEYKMFAIVIPNHIMVPKHIIMEDAEVAEFCANFHTQPSRMDKILVTDPPVVWLGARPGDVIKVIRDSEITGTSIGYRVVVRA